MDWYLPITILPGLGMLILSTTNQMMELSKETGVLVSKKCNDFQHKVANKKIKQLGLLTKAATYLYVASGLYVLSGILEALHNSLPFNVADMALYVGTALVFVALTMLAAYAYRDVKIRKFQYDNNHLAEE
ncbi:hypothetical protein [Niabella ginsengisoli]|uniref:DUF2721 domain-containing protein n=1 Tax=Niabella ginsengisoli TaxID=522298 RepID=A0ABS9SKJ7_9BACT|nr:hypothetical protein [Niabella ginsengisoli]MCH5598904.1 hypothetical protein [Niabella ginsengisoli]